MPDDEGICIADEFLGAQLGDHRRSRRLVSLAQALDDDPARSFPKSLDESALEGAYRFFQNQKVDSDGILTPHVERTLERIGAADVLVLHDTTLMAYRAGGTREGLSTLRKGEQEFLAHVSLAVTADGLRRPLGVLSLSTRKKQKRERGQRSDARASKEEFVCDYDRWLEHVERVAELPLERAQTIHVADREADDYELLWKITDNGQRFVIRSSHNRLTFEGEDERSKLRDRVEGAECRATRTVTISKRSGKDRGPDSLKTHPSREGREATVEMSAVGLTICKPRSKKTFGLGDTLNLNVVRVFEREAPRGEAPVEWLLLTSEPVETGEQIARVVDMYCARWVIEEYFKCLKTGCAYERRQLGTLHSLTNALAVFAPIAWRLLYMRSEARVRPDAPATTILTEDELFVLHAKARKRGPMPEQATVRDAVRAIAALGGHLKPKREPGWQIISEGYEVLMKWVAGYRLAKYGHEM